MTQQNCGISKPPPALQVLGQSGCVWEGGGKERGCVWEGGGKERGNAFNSSQLSVGLLFGF